MNHFEISWSYYEDYSPYIFCHESKTKEEFTADCKFLMIKYGNDYIEQETSWTSAPRWIEFILDKFSELGYVRVIPKCFNIFGSYIIKDEESDLKNIVGEALYNKAIQSNIKSENVLIEESK